MSGDRYADTLTDVAEHPRTPLTPRLPLRPRPAPSPPSTRPASSSPPTNPPEPTASPSATSPPKPSTTDSNSSASPPQNACDVYPVMGSPPTTTGPALRRRAACWRWPRPSWASCRARGRDGEGPDAMGQSAPELHCWAGARLASSRTAFRPVAHRMPALPLVACLAVEASSSLKEV